MITISIDVMKIDKSKLVAGKNGEKYYNITVDELKEPDRFGNTHTVYQSQSKDERVAKNDRVYLGKGKEWKFEQKRESTPVQVQAEVVPNTATDGSQPLPF